MNKETVLQAVLNHIAPTILGDGFELYKLGEQSLFSTRGPSGGLKAALVFYIVPKNYNLYATDIPSYGVQISNMENLEFLEPILKEAIRNFVAEIVANTCYRMNLNGGEFGNPHLPSLPGKV